MSIPYSGDEALRMQECSREPIATPGTVQAGGILLGLAGPPTDATVISVSDSCETVWGLRPDQVLDRPLAEFLVGFEPIRAASDRLGPRLVTDFHDTPWFATTTFAPGQTIVNLEPLGPVGQIDGTLWLADATATLDSVADTQKLWSSGCDTVRERIGFDRTIVLAFHDDGHGEVIAECRADGVDSLLGLHFPASDVPVQARAVYERVRSTLIRDTEAMPSIVVPRTDRAGVPWDLALSPLRHPSRRHLEFMRSMGTAASLTLHLTGDTGLEYMIVSHSFAPRTVDPLTRSGLELFSRLLHERVASLARIAEIQRRVDIAVIEQRLSERIGDGSILDALAAAASSGIDTVGGLELIHADAGLINVNGTLRTLGRIDPAETQAIHETVQVWLHTLSRHGALLTDRVSDVHPRLAAAAPQVAGLLAVSIGSQGDYLCWVRRPVDQTVRWLGSLEPENRDTPLSPRRDLSPWTDSITDASRAWSATDRDVAEELAREIEDSLLRRAQADLAHLALIDSLTGLPNRRLLLDRLDSAIARTHRGHHFVLLFIDLNNFKEINDRFGHRAGDAVLVETARRLTDAVRTTDTVSRLAGDEFVVLCEDTKLGEEEAVAERVRRAFDLPFDTYGVPLPIRAAIGIAQLELGLDAATMLDLADRAMYEAKATMKDGAALPSAPAPETSATHTRQE